MNFNPDNPFPDLPRLTQAETILANKMTDLGLNGTCSLSPDEIETIAHERAENIKKKLLGRRRILH